MKDSNDPIKARLEQGEKIIWRGQPDKYRYVTKGDGCVMPISAFWTLLTGLLVLIFIKEKSLLLFLLGMPFLLVSLYLLFGRYIHHVRVAGRIFYAVTDRRIIIITGRSSRNFTSLDIEDIPVINLRLRKNNIGDICFGNPPAWPVTLGFTYWLDAYTLAKHTPAFLCIKNVEEVYDRIRELKNRYTKGV